jgi:hypothetical protein
MTQTNEPYLIIGLNSNRTASKELWIVNSETKQRLRVMPVNYTKKILDIYACNSGIYHAEELIVPRSKNTGRTKYNSEGVRSKEIQTFNTNMVQIIDSISGNSSMTIKPEYYNDLPLENRLFKLDFKFLNEENYLGYKLGGTQGIIFPNCSKPNISEKIFFDNKTVYIDNRKITTFENNIFYAAGVDANKLAHAYRIKDKQKYKRNKNFFES